jgi:predicted ATP-dependent protease
MSDPYRLGPEEVAFSIDPESLKTIPLPNDEEQIIGQPRAVKALQMGTVIRAKGFNLVVSGIPGTGRHTAIRRILRDLPPAAGPDRDIAFVYNFVRPEVPMVLCFPPGTARRFKQMIHDLVEKLKVLIKARLSSEVYKNRRDRLVSSIEKEENHRLADFEAQLAALGFTAVRVEDEGVLSTDIAPLIDGEAGDFDQLQSMVAAGELAEEEWNRRRETYYRLMDEMRSIFSNLQLSRAAMEEELAHLQAETVRPPLHTEMRELYREFPQERIHSYLESLEQDIIERLFVFTGEEPSEDGAGNRIFLRYGVNILMEAGSGESPPVIYENNPTVQNLLGTIEFSMDLSGRGVMSFMSIRAGSMIRSSGGYLVIRLDDLLQEDGAWLQLKRALQTEKVEIQPPQGMLGMPAPQLKPEAVSVDLKVILVADEGAYDILYNADSDFAKFFKICAEFDSSMDLNSDSLARYMSFIRRSLKKSGSLEISWDGMAEVIAYGAYLADQRDKLSTQFSLISDLLAEASYWSGKNGAETIEGKTVQQALKERNYLFNLPEEKLEELILQGDILISIEGEQIGKVNGLAIHDRGYYAFGMPTLISARVAPGEEGLVNIEREVGLSGEIHDKGILILDGYMRARYAVDFPLAMYATICFEQSYSEIDGDSASSTEMYALLSAAGRIPLRQDIAVTGSMNQMGEIQPVGGISEKISGFFNICKKRGLSGRQGVIIPDQNRKNLFLNSEIRDAVAAGSFHIFPVSSIDQGMEILTGIPAGEPGRDGRFPPKSVNGRVERELRSMALLVKQFNN